MWSTGANWSSVPAPGPNAVLGTLSFPYLGAGCAYSASPTVTCYTGTDDLGAVSANQLQIDNTQGYDLEPNASDASGSDTLTLNPPSSPFIGLAAAPTASGETLAGFPYIGVPIKLGDNQTWTFDGASSYGFTVTFIPDVVDSSSETLDLRFSNNGSLYTTVLDTGALTIDGSGNVFLIPDNNNDQAVLPAAGITIPDGSSSGQPALNVEAPGVTSGPIDASAGSNYGNQFTVGAGSLPEATLTTSGDVSLGPGTAFGFSIDGNDVTPGLDSSEMTVNGNVALNGARMGMSQGWVDSSTDQCVNLTPGNTYTLLKTNGGTITGTMHYWDGTGYDSFVTEGQTSATPTPFGQNCTGGPAPEAYINYGSTAITETIAGAPASTTAPTITGTAAVGQSLSVSSNGGWTGFPAPNYTYQWMACASGTCTAIGSATGSSFTVTSAQEGDTIEAQVTATNALGHASANSNALGAVPTPTTSNPTPPPPTPTLPTGSQVIHALDGIGHPTGNKAITALIRTHSYKTSLQAPSAGSVSVVWTTVVTTGTGKHKKHRTVTVATGSGHATAAGRLSITIHLTAAGVPLVRRTPHNLHITATQKFEPTGGSWTTVVKHFTL